MSTRIHGFKRQRQSTTTGRLLFELGGIPEHDLLVARVAGLPWCGQYGDTAGNNKGRYDESSNEMQDILITVG